MNDQQLSHLLGEAEKDEIYQDIQVSLRIFEPEYRRILNGLSREDRHLLHMYVAAREGIESRLVRIAYFITPQE